MFGALVEAEWVDALYKASDRTASWMPVLNLQGKPYCQHTNHT
jgi:hypothetical protein